MLMLIQIVDETSSKMMTPGEVLIPMNSDHRQICKFSDKDDVSYQKVRNRIVEYVENSLKADKTVIQVSLTSSDHGGT
jgi:hypothetical protein